MILTLKWMSSLSKTEMVGVPLLSNFRRFPTPIASLNPSHCPDLKQSWSEAQKSDFKELFISCQYFHPNFCYRFLNFSFARAKWSIAPSLSHSLPELRLQSLISTQMLCILQDTLLVSANPSRWKLLKRFASL